jgi:hypothetical protein
LSHLFGANRWAQIAQLVEQRIENPRVRGSNPRLGTTLYPRDFVVSDVASPLGSSSILRSEFLPPLGTLTLGLLIASLCAALGISAKFSCSMLAGKWFSTASTAAAATAVSD